MRLKWIIAGLLIFGIMVCPASAGWLDWLFGTSDTSDSVVTNISTDAWPNGTATIESLDTTTGDVIIHYTMEYVPSVGGIVVELFDNSQSDGFPVWSGDASKPNGTWIFNLKEVNSDLSHSYTARLHKNEVGI